jgi:hypothetical protein
MPKFAAALGRTRQAEIVLAARQIGVLAVLRRPERFAISAARNPERFLKIFRCLGEAAFLGSLPSHAETGAHTVQK